MAGFYETDGAVAEYLLFHYGSSAQILAFPFGPREALEFPVRCVTECVAKDTAPEARALDLGCAVGRSSFELARISREVIGIDFSSRFISVAKALQQHGRYDYSFPREGALSEPATALVPADIDRKHVTFEQGDAGCLRKDLGEFDIVLLANLIDRLAQPRLCLQQLSKLVKTGGQLIITSPYTWLADYTPPEHWLGGYERDGQRVATLDTLIELLAPEFHLAGVKDLPLLIREHQRKFQWSVAEASLWRREG